MDQNVVSSGWNDPPANISSSSLAPNRLLRQRRPVDPSVQDASRGFMAGPNAYKDQAFQPAQQITHGSAAPQVYGIPPIQPTSFPASQHFSQSMSAPTGVPPVSAQPSIVSMQSHITPQPTSTGYPQQMTPMASVPPIGTHPASAFTPAVPSSLCQQQIPAGNVQHANLPVDYSQSMLIQQPQTMPLPPPPANFSSIQQNINNNSGQPLQQQQPAQLTTSYQLAANSEKELAQNTTANAVNNQLYSSSNGASSISNSNITTTVSNLSEIPASAGFTPVIAPPISTDTTSIVAPVTTAQFEPQSAMMVPVRTFEGDPSSLIFSPPNTVDFARTEQRRPITQPDPNTYVAPTKAAGDVSLSGPQLVAFLTKATFRLNQGTTREGIQLRIGQFNELIMSSQISDLCLKKLNFVVDAIDRGVFEEASQFFEQMQSAFPSETSAGWAHGVKILIAELKKSSNSLPPPPNVSSFSGIGGAFAPTMNLGSSSSLNSALMTHPNQQLPPPPHQQFGGSQASYLMDNVGGQGRVGSAGSRGAI